ncbi:hypothetical protein EVJ58_g3268 [Rhodofomes roseus]|uniref:Uncharacterized protein n=1 Tax=Rhodofomes roseus TaxID=34475 RepID=A0A4Y9YPG1_9APHY|nr:hypothetical protein EVJ58_g3268 [Rhodofomes roseus]
MLLTAVVTSTTTAVRLRIWRFQQKKGEWNIPLIAVIIFVASLSLLGISGGIGLFHIHLPLSSTVSQESGELESKRVIALLSLSYARPVQKALEATVAGGICADILLVVTLCLSLYRARSGLRRTDSALTLFILYSVYNGLLPTCFGIATLISVSAPQ